MYLPLHTIVKKDEGIQSESKGLYQHESQNDEDLENESALLKSYEETLSRDIEVLKRKVDEQKQQKILLERELMQLKHKEMSDSGFQEQDNLQKQMIIDKDREISESLIDRKITEM